MPPKKGPSKSTESKQKQKIVEDKTFGLKNKNKSAKVGKYVEDVKRQVMEAGNKKQLKIEEERKKAQLDKKKAEEAKKAELQELFKVVQIDQKVPFGVDPKTVLCVNFKNGACKRGDKCKFSHDLEVARKRGKIDLYTDRRDEDKEEDTMDKWDQAKLEEVVISKHGNPRTTTDIVCKFFLESIEEGKYGWFWECPGGGKICKYRHALPQGFVLKSKKKEDKGDAISIEEFIETERQKLGQALTPVTLESFTAWKATRRARTDALAKQERDKKEAAFRAGKALHVSGRELFEWKPEMAMEMDDADDDDEVVDMTQREDMLWADKVEVEEDLFAQEDVGDLDDDEEDEE